VSRGALARAGLIVTGAFLASRILGWLRVVVLGNLFGSPDRIAELDAYYAAFRIPDLIFELVAAGAITSALIPVLSGLIEHGEKARAWRVASTVLNLMLAALLVLAILLAIFAPAIVPLLVPGFDEATTELTVELTRLMLISPIFLAAGSIVTAILQTQDRFGATALAPVVYNASIIGGALLLEPVLGIEGVAVGVVVGAIGHVAIQLPALRGRFTYTPRVDASDKAARQTFWLMLPRAIGMGANQITFLVNTALASTVAVGAVVSYTVAFSVLQIPLGVIGLPLGIVLLPSMSRALANGDETEFGTMVVRALRLLLWVMALVAAIGIVTRDEVVDLLFGWGFDEQELAATAGALGVFLVGLPAHAMNVILARAFYSGKDTVTPVSVAVISVGVNVTISIATVGALGIQGLALGIALGAWFEATTLTILLRRKHPAIAARSVAQGGAISIMGALLAALVAAGVLALDLAPADVSRVVSLVIELALASGAGVAVFLLYSRLVRLPELPRAFDLGRSAVRGR
jgi:putative peptidoglycan lipid II flippase